MRCSNELVESFRRQLEFPSHGGPHPTAILLITYKILFLTGGELAQSVGSLVYTHNFEVEKIFRLDPKQVTAALAEHLARRLGGVLPPEPESFSCWARFEELRGRDCPVLVTNSGSKETRFR